MKTPKAIISIFYGLMFLAVGSVLLTACNNTTPATVPSADPNFIYYYEVQNFVTFGGGSLVHPAGMAMVGDKIWVVDQGNNSLQLWTTLYPSQQKNITSFNGGNTFNYPWGLTIDPVTNNLYVAGGSNGNVVIFDTNGNYLTTITAGASDVRGVAINAAGTTAYVTDYSGGGYIYTIGGTPTLPTFTFSTQFGTSGTGKLTNAYQCSVDPSGNVWVADYGGAKVVEYTSAGVYSKKLTSSKFVRPTDVKVRPNGDIIVTDEGADNIFAFSSALKKIGSYGGSPGYPEDIEESGSLFYVSDWQGGRIIGYR